MSRGATLFHLNMAISATIKEVQVHVGDIIRVHNRVVEGNKERVQIFEGMLLGIRGGETIVLLQCVKLPPAILV